MKFNPDIHHRKSIRLKNYDYSQAGLYFVTICTENRHCLFGRVENGSMSLNAVGNMIVNEWCKLGGRFQSIVLDEYVVMPNHFHGIFELVGARAGTSPAPTVGDVVGAFKSLSTNQYIQNVKQYNWQPLAGKLWQRNYFEHVIRNEGAYLKIAEYIQTNPLLWQEDTYYA